MTGKKILWLSHFVPYPPKGGCFQRTYNLLKAVAGKNEVTLVALRHKDKSTHPESEAKQAREELGKFCRKVFIIDISSFSGWRMLALAGRSLLSGDPLTVLLFRSAQMRALVKKLSRETAFDLVHYDTISLAEYFHDAGNIPKFLTHHGVESFMIGRRLRNEKNALKKLFLWFEHRNLLAYEKAHCPDFDLNIMVSEDDRKMLRELSPASRIEVVENGVDVDYFAPKGDRAGANRLIFAGRLDQYSNMDGILYFCTRVWPLVRERFPEMRFTIIGNHPSPKLLEIAKRDERIEILGYVDDVRPYFAEATISVCPIRDGGGTRIKILDAMAMGMPIISTSIGCEGIDVTPGKDVLIADTPDEYVDRIQTLVGDGGIRNRIGNSARHTAETIYSWKIIGEKLNRFYGDSVP